MTRIDIPSDSLFGLANLPYGVASVGDGPRRVVTRVGDLVVDLGAVCALPVLSDMSLDSLLAAGPSVWAEAREAVIAAVTGDLPDAAVHPVDAVTMHLPFTVGDYVDYYASEHHATNLGRLFRPGSEPLMPNWKHLPVGYHGRGGTIIESGVGIQRPCGQRKAPDAAAPTFGPTARLDIEAELGFVVGVGSALGSTIAGDDFEQHVFGVVIVNDWSARDIQAWEYVPLGPYLGKSFATSISPWVVPMAALQSAKCPLPAQDPQPLPYLQLSEPWGLDVDLEVEWNGAIVSRPPYATMYWSPAQMLAHMTVNGASTRTGDFFASGTISGPEKEQRGAFIELTWNGAEPVTVNGEERTFLLDGDEIAISASAPGPDGSRIGFGEVRARILPCPCP